MANLEKKSFDNPDELKTPEKTNAAVVNFGPVAASRVMLQPGWKWSECIKPVIFCNHRFSFFLHQTIGFITCVCKI